MGTTTCHRCGTVADTRDESIPLGWSSAATDDGLEVLCDRCTREHLRDIESKLGEEWWA